MRLSDFKDEKAIEVVADLIDPISVIAQEISKLKNRDNMTVAQLVGVAIKNCKKETIKMFAILNDIPEEEYHCTGASILGDMLNMFSDPQLMQLFGLQSETPTSSGSVSESTGVEKQ